MQAIKTGMEVRWAKREEELRVVCIQMMIHNHNTVGENGDFQPLHPKISRNSQTVSNAATVTINHQLEICCRFLRCRALTFASARLSCLY